MKNEIVELNQTTIKDKMYTIRNKKVMLDSDLAEIYGYNLSAFNQQVQRNIEKFDEDFMFQLTTEEYNSLRSQIVTLNGRGQHRKYLPYAFTEQGIYMLMTVLKGELAIRQSKALIKIFKEMKDFILENNNRYIEYKDYVELSTRVKNVEEKVLDKTTRKDVMNIIKNLTPEEQKEILILNGHQVESDIAYKNIYSKAQTSIFIIDNYINLKTLVLLKDIKGNVNVTIFTDNINKCLHKIEYEDFTKEYKNINITFKKTNNKIHDRYIILDYNSEQEQIYHCGSSSKDSGNKITTITKINDKNIFHNIIDNLLENKKLILT